MIVMWVGERTQEVLLGSFRLSYNTQEIFHTSRLCFDRQVIFPGPRLCSNVQASMGS